MPALAFDKFIPMLFILLTAIGVCLTWPIEVLVLLKIAVRSLAWAP